MHTKIVKIIAIIVAGIVGLSIIWYFVSHYNFPQRNAISHFDSDKGASGESKKDWQTYHDTSGYEIKYPTNWLVTKSENLLTINPNQTSAKSVSIKISIENDSLENIKKELINTQVAFKEIVLNSRNALQLQPSENEYDYFIENGNNVYKISLNTSKSLITETQQAFSIIGTFFFY
jgi:hypothetical protein